MLQTAISTSTTSPSVASNLAQFQTQILQSKMSHVILLLLCLIRIAVLSLRAVFPLVRNILILMACEWKAFELILTTLELEPLVTVILSVSSTSADVGVSAVIMKEFVIKNIVFRNNYCQLSGSFSTTDSCVMNVIFRNRIRNLFGGYRLENILVEDVILESPASKDTRLSLFGESETAQSIIPSNSYVVKNVVMRNIKMPKPLDSSRSKHQIVFLPRYTKGSLTPEISDSALILTGANDSTTPTTSSSSASEISGHLQLSGIRDCHVVVSNFDTILSLGFFQQNDVQSGRFEIHNCTIQQRIVFPELFLFDVVIRDSSFAQLTFEDATYASSFMIQNINCITQGDFRLFAPQCIQFMKTIEMADHIVIENVRMEGLRMNTSSQHIENVPATLPIRVICLIWFPSGASIKDMVDGKITLNNLVFRDHQIVYDDVADGTGVDVLYVNVIAAGSTTFEGNSLKGFLLSNLLIEDIAVAPIRGQRVFFSVFLTRNTDQVSDPLGTAVYEVSNILVRGIELRTSNGAASVISAFQIPKIVGSHLSQKDIIMENNTIDLSPRNNFRISAPKIEFEYLESVTYLIISDLLGEIEQLHFQHEVINSSITIRDVTCTPQKQLVCIYFRNSLTDVNYLIIDNVTYANIDFNPTNRDQFPASNRILTAIWFREKLENTHHISISNIHVHDVSCVLPDDGKETCRLFAVLFEKSVESEKSVSIGHHLSAPKIHISSLFFSNIKLISSDLLHPITAHPPTACHGVHFFTEDGSSSSSLVSISGYHELSFENIHMSQVSLKSGSDKSASIGPRGAASLSAVVFSKSIKSLSSDQMKNDNNNNNGGQTASFPPPLLSFKNMSLDSISVHTPVDLSETTVVHAKYSILGFSRVEVQQLKISNANITMGTSSEAAPRLQVFRAAEVIDGSIIVPPPAPGLPGMPPGTQNQDSSSSSSILITTTSLAMNNLVLENVVYSSGTIYGSFVNLVELGPYRQSRAALSGYDEVSLFDFRFQNATIFSNEGISFFAALLLSGPVSGTSSSSSSSLNIENFFVSDISGVTMTAGAHECVFAAVHHISSTDSAILQNFNKSITIDSITVQNIVATNPQTQGTSSFYFRIQAVSFITVENSDLLQLSNLLIQNCSTALYRLGSTVITAFGIIYQAVSLQKISLKNVQVKDCTALHGGVFSSITAVNIVKVFGIDRDDETVNQEVHSINETTGLFVQNVVVENIYVVEGAIFRTVDGVSIGRSAFLREIDISGIIMRNVVHKTFHPGFHFATFTDVVVKAVAFSSNMRGALFNNNNNNIAASTPSFSNFSVTNVTLQNIDLVAYDDGKTVLQGLYTYSLHYFGSVVVEDIVIRDCAVNGTETHQMIGYLSHNDITSPLSTSNTASRQHQEESSSKSQYLFSISRITLTNNTILNSFDTELYNVRISDEIRSFATVSITDMRLVNNSISSTIIDAKNGDTEIGIFSHSGSGSRNSMQGVGELFPEVFSHFIVHNFEVRDIIVHHTEETTETVDTIIDVLRFGRSIRGFHLVDLHSMTVSGTSISNAHATKLRSGYFRLVRFDDGITSALPSLSSSSSSSSSSTTATTNTTSFSMHNLTVPNFTATVSSNFIFNTIFFGFKIGNFSNVAFSDMTISSIALTSLAGSAQIIFRLIQFESNGVVFGHLDTVTVLASVSPSLLPLLNNQRSGTGLLFENLSVNNINAHQKTVGADIALLGLYIISNYQNTIIRAISVLSAQARISDVKIISSSGIRLVYMLFVSNIETFVVANIEGRSLTATSTGKVTISAIEVGATSDTSITGSNFCMVNINNISITNILLYEAFSRGLYYSGSAIAGVSIHAIVSSSSSSSSFFNINNIFIKEGQTEAIRDLTLPAGHLQSTVRAVEMGGLTPIESSSASSTTSFHHQFFGFDFVTISDLQINSLQMNSQTIDESSSTHSTGNNVAGISFVRLPTTAHSVVTISNIILLNLEIYATILNTVTGVQSSDVAAMAPVQAIHIKNITLGGIYSAVYFWSLSSIAAVNFAILENIGESFLLEDLHFRDQISCYSQASMEDPKREPSPPSMADSISSFFVASVRNLPSSSTILIRNIKADYSSRLIPMIFNSTTQTNITMVTVTSIDTSTALGSIKIENCEFIADLVRSFGWTATSFRKFSILVSVLQIRNIISSSSSSSSSSIEMNSNKLTILNPSKSVANSPSNFSILFLDPSSMISDFHHQEQNSNTQQQQIAPLNIRMYYNEIHTSFSSSENPQKILTTASLIATSANSSNNGITPPPLAYSISLEDNFVPFDQAYLFSTPTSNEKTEDLQNLMLVLHLQCNRWLRLVERQLRANLQNISTNEARVIRLCTSPTRTFTMTHSRTASNSSEKSLTVSEELTPSATLSSTFTRPPSLSQSVSTSSEPTSTNNVTASHSPEDTSTPTFIVPPPPYVSPLQSVYNTVSDTSTLSQALTFSSAAALTAVRARATLSGVNKILTGNCGVDDSSLLEMPDVASSPLRLYLESGGYISGLVIGNFALIVASGIFWYSAYLIKSSMSSNSIENEKSKRRDKNKEKKKKKSKSSRKDKKSSKDSFFTRFVTSKAHHVMFIFMDILLEPTFTSAVELLFYSEGQVALLMKLICSVLTFFFFVLLGYFAVINYFFFSRPVQDEIYVVPSDDEKRNENDFLNKGVVGRSLEYWLAPEGDWEWPDLENGNEEENNNDINNSDSKEVFDEEAAELKFIHKRDTPFQRMIPPEMLLGNRKSKASKGLVVAAASTASNGTVACKRKKQLYNSSSSSSLSKPELEFLAGLHFLEPFRKSFPKFIIVELLTVILMSLCFIVGAATGRCMIMGIGMCVILGIHALLVLYFQPYVERFFRGSVPILDLSSIALLAIALKSTSGESMSIDDIETISGIALYLSILQSVIAALTIFACILGPWNHYQKKKKLRKLFEEAKSGGRVSSGDTSGGNQEQEEEEEERLLIDHRNHDYNNNDDDDDQQELMEYSPRSRMDDETPRAHPPQKRTKRKTRRENQNVNLANLNADNNDESQNILSARLQRPSSSPAAVAEEQQEDLLAASPSSKKKKIVVMKKRKKNRLQIDNNNFASSSTGGNNASNGRTALTSSNLQQALLMSEDGSTKRKINTSWL